jgi:hypothetical protein
VSDQFQTMSPGSASKQTLTPTGSVEPHSFSTLISFACQGDQILQHVRLLSRYYCQRNRSYFPPIKSKADDESLLIPAIHVLPR